MKFGTAKHEGETILVTLIDEIWVNLSRAHADYRAKRGESDTFVGRGIRALVEAGLFNKAFHDEISGFVREGKDFEAYALEDPPCFRMPLRPGKIIAIGRNYRAHAEELGNEAPGEPIFFAKTPSICVGPEDPIVLKEWYGRVDHEGELAVLIGKRAKDVAPENAAEYIAGYTIVNDVTAREIQKRDQAESKPWYPAKNLDTFCPIGPVVVLPDAMPSPLEVDIKVRVNGEIRQDSNTRRFIFSLGEQIAAVTRFLTLEPGDLIATGTPEGVSPLHPGDEVEVSIPEIGVLRNPVISGD